MTSSAEQALFEIRSSVQQFATPELRQRLHYQLRHQGLSGDIPALPCAARPDIASAEILEVTSTVSRQAIELQRPQAEPDVVVGGGKRRRLQSLPQSPCKNGGEVAAIHESFRRAQESWSAERCKVERDRDDLARDLKFVSLRLESREEELREQRRNSDKERREAQLLLMEQSREGFVGAASSLEVEAAAGAAARRVTELQSTKVQLEAQVASLELTKGSVVREVKAQYERELLDLRSRLEASEATTHNLRQLQRAAEAKVSSLEQDRRAAVELPQQLTSTVRAAEASAPPQENRDEDARLLVAAREQIASMSSAVAERDRLLDQVAAWDSLFASEGLGDTPTAVQVYKSLSQSRAAEVATKALLGRSEVARREFQSRFEEASANLATLRKENAAVAAERDSLAQELASSYQILDVKDAALARREKLLRSYEAAEERPGKRSDDQRTSKERALEEENAQLARRISELVELHKAWHSGAADRDDSVALRCELLERELAESKRAHERCMRSLEEAEATLEAQRVAGATGKTVLAGSKVLHMSTNPSAEAARERRLKEQKRVEALEEENEQLRREASLRISSGQQKCHACLCFLLCCWLMHAGFHLRWQTPPRHRLAVAVQVITFQEIW